MKLGYAIPILAALIQTSAHASALIQKDDDGGVIRYISQLNFSGPAMTEQNARESAEEISHMWNESRTQLVINGKTYRTEFVISYVLNRSEPFITMFDSCAENYITVKDLQVPGNRSEYQVGGNNGTFYTSDDLGHSTTVAHEYGHGLGLQHNPTGQRAAQVPGIMFARGTFVAPQFQYDPNAASGAAGGTINPIYRHVRTEDIAKIGVSHLTFVGGYACIGRGVAKPIEQFNVVSRMGTIALRTPIETAERIGAALGLQAAVLGTAIDNED